MKNDIKCKYCGKIYSSPSEMRKRKCHSHPDGAWCGYCTPDRLKAMTWQVMEDIRRRGEDAREREIEEAKFVREYKKHTPLLDCMLKRELGRRDEPSEYHLQLRNSDLNDVAVAFANGINSETQDAINTVYALRSGCDYVLNNADAQKEGSLNTWLDEIKRLKDEVVSWDFWVSLYWLTKPIKTQVNAVGDDDWENDRKKWNYWHGNSIAILFHTRQVIPMMHAVNGKGDEKENQVLKSVESYVQKLKDEKSKEKDFDPRQMKCIEALCRNVKDYSFWGVLYCLYWMGLLPTPWDDQKVWPIQMTQKENSASVKRCEFAKKLLEAYSKNYAPFKKLWIYKENTLVFDEYSVDGKTVAIDVAALPDEKVNVTFLMRNGKLNDVQAFAGKNAQLKPLFTETVAQRILHSKIAYADVPAFINKVLAALRSPTPQKVPEADSKTEGAAKSVKSSPVASVAVQSFNAGEMLKTLRGAALGMSWRESKDKTPYWGALVDGVAICSWQKRIQSNLSCELNLSSDKTHIYKGECWMQCTMRFETKDGKSSLNIWGEFWGYWLDGKQSKIDFTQPPVSATLATVERTFSSAWKPFGVTGNIGHHEKNIWFNVAIPITSIDVIRESKFGADLRASLSKVVRSFATLKPFCTWK